MTINKLTFKEKEDMFLQAVTKGNHNGHLFRENKLERYASLTSTECKNSLLNENKYPEERDYNDLICSSCGEKAIVDFKDKKINVLNKCIFPFQDLKTNIEINSGKLVSASFLPEIYQYIDERSSHGYSSTHLYQLQQLKHFARHNLLYLSVPNGQPQIYLKDETYYFIEGSDSDIEDVNTWEGLKPILNFSECFYIDYDAALKIKDKILSFEENFTDFQDINEFDIIDIPKGNYEVNIKKESLYNRKYRWDECFILATMKKIS